MNKATKEIMTALSKMAYSKATKEANNLCTYWHNQPKIPDKVDMLRKTKIYDK